MSVSEPLPESSITVSLPSRAELLHVMRAVAASVAGRLDFPYDAVDDLRLAVDEACAQLLAVRGPGSSLQMTIHESEMEVALRLALAQPSRPWPPEGLQRTLAWQVLSALADEAEIGSNDGAPSISLRKRLAR